MTMVAGNITVDPNSGQETFTPNDSTNCAKFLYTLKLADAQTVSFSMPAQAPPTIKTNPDGTTTTIPGKVLPPVIGPDGKASFTMTQVFPNASSVSPQTKIAIAKDCVSTAAMITFLQSQATVSITIAADTSGDGLQTSQTAGSATTHPASPKTITGTLT